MNRRYAVRYRLFSRRKLSRFNRDKTRRQDMPDSKPIITLVLLHDSPCDESVALSVITSPAYNRDCPFHSALYSNRVTNTPNCHYTTPQFCLRVTALSMNAQLFNGVSSSFLNRSAKQRNKTTELTELIVTMK